MNTVDCTVLNDTTVLDAEIKQDNELPAGYKVVATYSVKFEDAVVGHAFQLDDGTFLASYMDVRTSPKLCSVAEDAISSILNWHKAKLCEAQK